MHSKPAKVTQQADATLTSAESSQTGSSHREQTSTHRKRTTGDTIPQKRVHDRIQVDTTLNPHAATNNLTHQLAGNYTNGYRRVLANELIGTHTIIHPRQQQLVLAKIGSLVPVLPHAKPAPMATPTSLPDFPQLLPRKEEFLSSETELRLLVLGNPVGLYVCLECILITEV